MLGKVEGKKNGYAILEDTTNEEFRSLLKSYPKVRCIICNERLAKRIQYGVLGHNITTINNKIPDEIFYINGVY